MTRFSAVGISVVTILSFNLVGCGDGEQGTASEKELVIGGTTSTSSANRGGGTSTATDGGATSGGSTSTTGDSAGGAAGTSTAAGGATGSSSTTGTATSGGGSSGGSSSSSSAAGGSSESSAGQGQGGSSATSSGQGGAVVAGNAGRGGGTTGGTAGVSSTAAGSTGLGGAVTGGVAGAADGGTSASGASTGGVATGGAATGGDNTGGIATGGVATGGTTAVIPCVVSFISPADGSSLANANDLDGNCANGIQANVVVVTNAASGVGATLLLTDTSGTPTPIATTNVGSNLLATFGNVGLPSSGQVVLTANVGDALCTTNETITLDCSGAPACSISSPVMSPTHPLLNGVPTSSKGDRSSNDGAPYQTPFTVATDAPDGNKVTLTIDGTQTVQSTIATGTASFAGVLLGSDGDHTVQASCNGRNGQVGSTSPVTYTVDATAPALTISKIVGDIAAANPPTPLVDGDHFSVADDADSILPGLQLRLCGTTTSSDAIDLNSVLTYSNNFCVSIGGTNSTCVPVTSAGSGTACALLDCPGNGAFDVKLTVYDTAGNPTVKSANNLTCSSTAPSVAFIDPVAGTDFDKRILAFNNALATRKDADGVTPGAQYDIVTCTSATSGTATLAVGRAGDVLTDVQTQPVTSDTANVCNGNYPSTVKFTNVTLPESVTDAAFNLAIATRLEVTVTDQNLDIGVGDADIWVDSYPPILTVKTTGLCGSYINSASSPYSQNVAFSTSLVPVNVLVVNNDGTSSTATGTILATSTVTVPVQFTTGINTLSATVAEPSGNTTSVLGCQVTLGTSPPPTVTWSNPVATNLLTAPGSGAVGAIADGDPGTPGWQGTLKVCTNVDLTANPGATVQFTANGNPVGSAAIDSSKCATLTTAVVSEGAAVQLTATTSAMANGTTGAASITIPVDVTKPGAPSSLTVSPKDRRQTSFQMAWTAAADGTQNAAGYDVRVATVPITASNFDDGTQTQTVPYTGVPANAGSPDSLIVVGKLIETDYYFALRAKDAAGNRSDIVTSGVTRAQFLVTTIAPPSGVTGKVFGSSLDGSSDLNADGYSDLVIGSAVGREVDIYFGNANFGYVSGSPVSPSPNVRITSSNNTFGATVAVVGDVNNDGYPDIAVATPSVVDGRINVFCGRKAWPSALSETDACWTIVPDTSQTGGAGYAASRFGTSIARLGDFNSDGYDDFAVGAPGYASSQGHVTIVLGKNTGATVRALYVPQAFGTNDAIRLDGDTSVAGAFGQSAVGIGHWYAQPTAPVLVVAATNYNSVGKLYSFAGVNPSTTVIPVSAALNTVLGSASGDFLGNNGLKSGGDLGVAGKGAILAGRTNSATPPGYADLFSGADAEGPFGRLVRLTTTESSTVSGTFGKLMVAGGLPGTTAVVSYIGDSRADLVVGTRIGTPRIYLVDGQKVATLFASSTGATIQSKADVTYTLPGTWSDFASKNITTRDLDKDGYGDISIGESATSAVDGKVVVLR